MCCRTTLRALLNLATCAIVSAARHLKSLSGSVRMETIVCRPPKSAMARRMNGFLDISFRIWSEPILHFISSVSNKLIKTSRPPTSLIANWQASCDKLKSLMLHSAIMVAVWLPPFRYLTSFCICQYSDGKSDWSWRPRSASSSSSSLSGLLSPDVSLYWMLSLDALEECGSFFFSLVSTMVFCSLSAALFILFCLK